MQQSCGRIDIQRCSYHHEYIRFLRLYSCRFYHGDTLTKEDDEWTKQRTVGGCCTDFHFRIVFRQFLHIILVIRITRRTHLRQLTMQVNHLRRTCFLVQVIHILGDDRHIVVLLQFGNQPMPLVRFCSIQFLAQSVIKFRHQCGVALPSLVCCHILYREILPETVIAAERLKTTLHRHSGTRQKHQFLFHIQPPY